MTHKACGTAGSGKSSSSAGERLSLQEQLELLEVLERRHEEVLQLIDDLEARVVSLLRDFSRGDRSSRMQDTRQGQSSGVN